MTALKASTKTLDRVLGASEFRCLGCGYELPLIVAGDLSDCGGAACGVYDLARPTGERIVG